MAYKFLLINISKEFIWKDFKKKFDDTFFWENDDHEETLENDILLEADITDYVIGMESAVEKMDDVFSNLDRSWRTEEGFLKKGLENGKKT